MGKMEMSELIREPCPCGAGSVVLRHYSPEYMYGTAYTEHGIDCVECRTGYVVQEKLGDLYLFRRADDDRVYALARLSKAAHDELHKHVLAPMAQRICAEAIKHGRTFEKNSSMCRRSSGCRDSQQSRFARKPSQPEASPTGCTNT